MLYVFSDRVKFDWMFFQGTVVDILYNGSQTDLEKCQMKGGEIPTVSQTHLCHSLFL